MSAAKPVSATPTRAIVFLAFAGFASQAMVRVADPLLPQIAADIGTTVGTASIVTSAYAISHGLTQLFGSPIGDRFPKFVLVALLCGLCAIATTACGLSRTLTELGISRLACGLTAGMIIPLAMAFIGDTVPYEARQPVLGRFLAGQITGLVGGQIIGGVVGDHFGWRNVFVFVAGLFAIAVALLVFELVRNPMTRHSPHARDTRLGFAREYAAVFGSPWARVVILGVFLEAAIMFSAFAYIGADLHARMGLGFSAVGAVLAAFGIGGLTYVLTVRQLVERLGQVGLVIAGGAMLTLSFLALALSPVWWLSFCAIAVIGLAFYMVHNTLQVNATQMAPQARATAIGVFSSALYVGQGAGVAAAAPIVDRYGAAPVFMFAVVAWPLLCWWFSAKLRTRREH
jgi:MFS transporter, YNFM family, putative membrane transport protein